jgi:hypothetical protein
LKKALVYIFLALFLLNTTGYYYLFEINRQIAKKTMERAIRKTGEDLLVFIFQDVKMEKDFQRVGRKEFRYKGAMYDIVREIRKGSQTTFVCKHDARESALNAGLGRLAQNKLYFTCLDQMNLLFEPGSVVEYPPYVTSELVFPLVDFPLQSSFVSEWSPPPEFS